MNKYDRLLIDAADELSIQKGKIENEISYKSRIIYSIVCRMAHAALWDELEDWTLEENGEPISIVHFKRRIEKTLNGYKKMYPEIISSFSEDDSELSQYIYNLFGATGQFYHTPYRIKPPIQSSASLVNVSFERGISPLDKVNMSGAGMYKKAKQQDPVINVQTMYGLCKTQIDKALDIYSDGIIWEQIEDDSFEYLNEEQSFRNVYWVKHPVKNRELSIARTKDMDIYKYYFYRNADRLEYSFIPEYVYRLEPAIDYHTPFLIGSLANAVLKKYNRLPSIIYRVDGTIVYVELNYLLPPNEMNLLCLYSWPETMQKYDNRFNRVLSTDVFYAIKKAYEQVGFSFLEE